MHLSISTRIFALVAALVLMLLCLLMIFTLSTWGAEWFRSLSPIQQYWIPKVALAASLIVPAIGMWLSRGRIDVGVGAKIRMPSSRSQA